MNPVNQKEIDDKMKELDGTANKGKVRPSRHSI